MKILRYALAVSMLLTTAQAPAMGVDDDPLLFMVLVDQLEWRDSDEGEAMAWEAQAWLGYDINRLWFKTEGEYENSSTEKAEAQLLYSRAISAYWNIQAGWRRDFKPEPETDWAVIGLHGMAPYYFEVDTSLFLRGSGQANLRFEAEYELLLTQRLVLTPEIEVNFHAKDDPEREVGSGLSDLELGLRLRYEIRREFAPYLGVSWEKSYGKTADWTIEAGGESSELQWVAGVRAWF